MFGIYLKNKEMVYKPNEGLVKADRIAEGSGSDIGENPWQIFTALRFEDGLEIVISAIDGEIVDRLASPLMDSIIDKSTNEPGRLTDFMAHYVDNKSEFADTESHIFNASESKQNGPVPNSILICDREKVSYGWIKDSNTEPFNTEYQGSLLEQLKSL